MYIYVGGVKCYSVSDDPLDFTFEDLRSLMADFDRCVSLYGGGGAQGPLSSVRFSTGMPRAQDLPDSLVEDCEEDVLPVNIEDLREKAKVWYILLSS